MKTKIILFLLFCLFTSNMQALDSIYIAEIKQSFLLKDTAALHSYFDSIKYLSINRDQKASYCQLGLEVSEEIGDPLSIFNFCTCFLRLNNFHLSDTIYINRALEVIPDISLPNKANFKDRNISLLYEDLSRIYNTSDLHFLAIKSNHKAIEHAKKANRLYNIPLGQMGNTHLRLGNYEKAIDYFNQTLELLKNSTDTIKYHLTAYQLCISISSSYFQLGNEELATKYAVESESHFLKTSERFKEKKDLPANIYPFSGHDKFNYYFFLHTLGREGISMPWTQEELRLKAISYKDPTGGIRIDSAYLELVAAIEKKEIKKSRQIFEEYAPIFTEYDPDVCVLYYKLTGDYSKALSYQERLTEEEEERLSALHQHQIAFADAEYRTKEKELKIINLEQVALSKGYKFRLMSGGGVGLVLLLMLMAYILRQRNSQKELLTQDVTNKERLLKQTNELVKSEALRNHMAINIAHELRTPLTFINSALKHMQKHFVHTPRSEDSINRALLQSAEIEQMSEQIINLSSNKLSTSDLDIHRFTFLEFLEYIYAFFEFSMSQKDIQFTINKSVFADITLLSDVNKLITVFKNLIGNALKFTTPGGKISIDGFVHADKLEIRIEDTGKGILKTEIERVFDRFYQGKESTNYQSGGFGIGLSICQEYLSLLEGNIDVKSKINEGSQFIIKLPIVKKGVENSSTYLFPKIDQKILPKEDSLSDDFILVVDDNTEMCAYLVELLEKDYNIITAHNGHEALKVLSRHKPMLIITDLMMPLMDGMRLIQKIKESIDWSTIPILILTAKNNILDELKASRIGVEGYIMKPFDEDELKANISHFLELAAERLGSEIGFSPELPDAISNIETSINNLITEDEKQWLEEIEEIISSKITNYDLDVDTLANLSTISPSYLTRKMKAMTGLTPKKYITEIRLLSAKKMIDKKEYNTVKSIAYSVGFKSVKTFSRNFKTRFGKYPSEYLS